MLLWSFPFPHYPNSFVPKRCRFCLIFKEDFSNSPTCPKDGMACFGKCGYSKHCAQALIWLLPTFLAPSLATVCLVSSQWSVILLHNSGSLSISFPLSGLCSHSFAHSVFPLSPTLCPSLREPFLATIRCSRCPCSLDTLWISLTKHLPYFVFVFLYSLPQQTENSLSSPLCRQRTCDRYSVHVCWMNNWVNEAGG